MKKSNKNNEVLKQISDKKLLNYLINGEYVYIKTGKNFLVLNDHNYINKIINMFRFNKLKEMIYLIRRWNSSKFYVDHSVNNFDFYGQALMFSRNSDYKLFDFDGRKVLTLFENKRRYIKIKRNIIFFEKFYNIPKIEFNDDNNITVEEYIYFKNQKMLDKKEIKMIRKQLLSNTIKIINYQKENNLLRFLKLKEYFSEIDSKLVKYEEINNILNSIRIDNLYLCMQHGDINFQNILVEENSNSIYFIDWEDALNTFFLYDYLTLLFNEAFFIINMIMFINF